jgi:tetratricopeptide (TPR) repeat protein
MSQMDNNSRKQQIIKMLEVDPNDAFLMFALAKELENEEDYKESEKIYTELIQLHPDYTGTYYHYGKLLEHLNQIDKAKEIYQLGITKCLASNDLHSRSELQSALMNLQI